MRWPGAAGDNDAVLIARGQMIGDLEAVEVRDLLRRLAGKLFTAEGLAALLAGTDRDPAEVLGMLAHHGLVESGAERHTAPVVHGDGELLDDAVLWQNTIAGSALAKARIGTPMPRARAEALLAGVIERAREVNGDPGQLFWVESIELFGSLSRPDTTRVGDVDLRVLIAHRYAGDALLDELARRWPRNAIDALNAATRELHRCLTGGSRKIDLQLDETISLPLPDGAQPVTVYTRR